MNNSLVHLAFCLHQKNESSPYPMALAATYVSIRDRTSVRLCLHILLDKTVSIEARDCLQETLRGEDQIIFYDIETIGNAHELACEVGGQYSPAPIWRVWLADYLSGLDRCILLDCDLQFLMDIEEIWSLPLDGCTLMASRGGSWRLTQAYFDLIGIPKELYFRMGVCLIDLNKVRENKDFKEQRVAFLREVSSRAGTMPGSYLFEQSLYNHFFAFSSGSLPFEMFAANSVRKNQERHQYLLKSVASELPLILDMKGWKSDSEFCVLFWSCLLRTPWASKVQEQLTHLALLNNP